MSDLLQLFRTFVRTVEAGSFTAVARDLNSSQPTISRQVSLLEEHLGCLLFQRTTRTLALTDDGRTFYQHALRTLEAAAEAEGAVGRGKSKPAGRLRLACPGVLGRLHVIPRLARFQALYPDIEIALHMADGFTDLVEEGIDLAIRVGELKDNSFVARRIGSSRRLVVATPQYLSAYGAPAHPRDLAGHRCVVYDRLLAGAVWSFMSPEGPLSVPVSGPLCVNNTEAVRAAVLEGLGVGYTPVWHFVDGELEDGRLVALLREFEPPPQPISAVYATRRFLPPKVRGAIDFFAAEFEKDPRLRTGP